MVRINLLPREIGEKRKYERRIGYALVGGAAVYIALFAIYAILSWTVTQRSVELQSNLDLAASLNNQAEAFRIFEDKEQDLVRRVAVSELALAQRVDWGRIANEVSLVLPSDVWITSMTGDEEAGLDLVGVAVDSATDIPDQGHKAVAKTLVRLSGLAQLRNIWLNSSVSSEFDLGAAEKHPILEFQISSDVVRPSAPAAENTGAPAPPAPSGQ